MAFNRMNVRQLAQACGRESYRSAVGHLHSGHRASCSPHLARRIEEALRLFPGALFELRMSGVRSDVKPAPTAPTRGRRAA